MTNANELKNIPFSSLVTLAKELGIKKTIGVKREDLETQILELSAEKAKPAKVAKSEKKEKPVKEAANPITLKEVKLNSFVKYLGSDSIYEVVEKIEEEGEVKSVKIINPTTQKGWNLKSEKELNRVMDLVSYLA